MHVVTGKDGSLNLAEAAAQRAPAEPAAPETQPASPEIRPPAAMDFAPKQAGAERERKEDRYIKC